MAPQPAYIIAARRSALGRVGGLHARRRVEDIAAPVIQAALGDCKINPALVDSIIVGNVTETGNPARLIALASGLPDTTAALTLDRQCASGLDAIIDACLTIGAGGADVIVAGGVEALSTAPWRVAKPKALHHMPRFVGFEPVTAGADDEPQAFEASERLARDAQLSRSEQDTVARQSHANALLARDAKRFVGEIVPLRSTPDEARDEIVRDWSGDDLERLMPFLGEAGTLTAGNTSTLADGAAFVVVICERIWTEIGSPKALKLVGSSVVGVAPDREAFAAEAATERLMRSNGGLDIGNLDAIELSETSAAQLIAYARHFGLAEARINTGGGAIARGHPLAAAGAVLVVRLFSELVRAKPEGQHRALATLSAIGGLGVAAVFQST
jgi:acetyl-CoA C-acetyltransferase